MCNSPCIAKDQQDGPSPAGDTAHPRENKRRISVQLRCSGPRDPVINGGIILLVFSFVHENSEGCGLASAHGLSIARTWRCG